MQLQGTLAPLCGTNVLVWDYGDHLCTLHYRHRPRLWAGVPGHPHHNQKDGPFLRQGLVSTQDPHCPGHHCCYQQIERTFLSFLHLVPCCGITRDSFLSSRSSVTWFVRGEPSYYGGMIGEWSPSFPFAYLEPLVCVLG